MLYYILGIVFASLLLYSYIFTNILIHNKIKPYRKKQRKIKKVKQAKIKVQKETANVKRIFSTIFSIVLGLVLIASVVLCVIFSDDIYKAIIITVAATIIISIIKYFTYKVDFPGVLEIVQNLVYVVFAIFLFIILKSSFNNFLLILFICLGIIVLTWLSYGITSKLTDDFLDDEWIMLPVIVTALAILTFIISLFAFLSVGWMLVIIGGILLAIVVLAFING